MVLCNESSSQPKEAKMATANANGIQIEYDTFGKSSHPALLLIIGLSGQLIYWQDEFCQQIADKGFYVIRYDNRDSGLSTKFDGLSSEEIMEKIMALFSGQKVSVPYTIEDMSNDAVGLLDEMKIEKAHICGMSMGGYIAQTFAINNPLRTISLTSIYSHTGDRSKFLPSQEIMEAMMKPVPRDRDGAIDYAVDFFKLIYGSGLPFDEEFHKRLAAQAFDRSFCPDGTGRQYLAIMVQENRTDELGKLKIPSLVIHGDEDPLVPFAGGKATSEAIPDAEFMVVKGMGHVLPNLNAYWGDIKDAIISHMGKAT
jgi:pimeloyl-ACP methyl ester carboxylesterase